MTLTEFLTARLDEDEALVDTMPEWYCTDSARGEGWGSRGDCPICHAPQFDGDESVTKQAMWEHLEDAHQRTRVLADVAAKRAILEDARLRTIHPTVDLEQLADHRTLCHLASVYADHPDYQQEWKP